MVFYRNARRLHPYATCDSCGEYRRHAIVKDGQEHICLCCKAMRAKPNRRTIPKCLCCGRTDLPFERHHVFGFKLHRALGKENETTKICLNCHAVLTAYLYPVMILQSLMLDGHVQENVSDEMRIKILQLFIIVVIAYLALEYDHQQRPEDFSNIICKFLRKLKPSAEIREAIFDFTRKLERDRKGQKQIEARITGLGA
jgi:hypothetical protein